MPRLRLSLGSGFTVECVSSSEALLGLWMNEWLPRLSCPPLGENGRAFIQYCGPAYLGGDRTCGWSLRATTMGMQIPVPFGMAPPVVLSRLRILIDALDAHFSIEGASWKDAPAQTLEPGKGPQPPEPLTWPRDLPSGNEGKRD